MSLWWTVSDAVCPLSDSMRIPWASSWWSVYAVPCSSGVGGWTASIFLNGYWPATTSAPA